MTRWFLWSSVYGDGHGGACGVWCAFPAPSRTIPVDNQCGTSHELKSESLIFKHLLLYFHFHSQSFFLLTRRSLVCLFFYCSSGRFAFSFSFLDPEDKLKSAQQAKRTCSIHDRAAEDSESTSICVVSVSTRGVRGAVVTNRSQPEEVKKIVASQESLVVAKVVEEELLQRMSDSGVVRNRDSAKTKISKKSSPETEKNGTAMNGSSASTHKKKKGVVNEAGGGMNRQLRKLFFIVLGLGFVTMLYYFVTKDYRSVPHHSVNWWDENIYLKLGLQKKTYAVIVDAGSTGSRLLAFEFHQDLSDKNLKLKSELFEEVKPGLSAYADTPAEAGKSLQSLLDKARNYIPESEWSSTSITLKATAGLRLLPKEKADNILNEVSEVISKSGFHAAPGAVGIMDGVDEGIFSWFTVNFLLDRIGDSVAKTVAALDLGGGSTQITVAASPHTIDLYPKESIVNISLFHEQVPIYTQSYLGLGLQSVRKAVLAFNKTDHESNVLISPCVNPKVSRDWTHGGVTYTVKGLPNSKFQKVQYEGFTRKEPVADWDACYKIIVDIIKDKNPLRSRDFNRQVVVFSYFTERAAEAGLVDAIDGGKLTLKHYFDAGKLACNTVNADLPLLCLDLTYMGALLHNGYGLANHTPILALKKIHGHELSWALGAAYHILQNGA